MLGIILAVIIFGLIILIHEFGHYIVGKLSGCSVSKFSIGWGPKLVSFKKRETEYQVSWIPLIGGYVRMPGMEGESAALTKEEEEDIRKYNLKTFEEIRTWQKFLVFIAGIGMQLATAVLLLSVVIAVMGKPVSKLYIAQVNESSPAATADLKPADIIVNVDDTSISSVEDLTSYLKDKENIPVEIEIKRGDSLISRQVIPIYNEQYHKVVLGVNIAPTLYFDKSDMSWYDYTFGGIVFTGELSLKMLEGIWMLISGKLPFKESAMGPVGIVAVTKDIIKTGFFNVIMFFILININLAFINLLPFPALDGGHVLFLAIEKTFRVKISSSIKEKIIIIGFSILLLFILYVTFNDIMRIRKINRIERGNSQIEEEIKASDKQKTKDKSNKSW
jgi:regulator of sigma E protease